MFAAWRQHSFDFREFCRRATCDGWAELPTGRSFRASISEQTRQPQQPGPVFENLPLPLPSVLMGAVVDRAPIAPDVGDAITAGTRRRFLALLIRCIAAPRRTAILKARYAICFVGTSRRCSRGSVAERQRHGQRCGRRGYLAVCSHSLSPLGLLLLMMVSSGDRHWRYRLKRGLVCVRRTPARLQALRNEK